MLHVKKNMMILGAAVLAFLFIDVSFAQTYYGSQLMNPEERAEHQEKMRSLPPSEREAYRAEQHEEMKKRAESTGLSLPDEPPTYGQRFGRRGLGYGRRGPGYGYGRRGLGYGYGRRGGPGYGYGRGVPRDWGPGYGYGRGGRGYWGPGYGGWGDRGLYGPGYGDWGSPAW